MKTLEDLTVAELKQTNGGGFDPISTAIGVVVALAIWAYDYGKDAAERERRLKAAAH